MAKLFYLKERNNPQFNKPYFSRLGQRTKKEIKEKEKNTLYGNNRFISYETKEEYERDIKNLEEKGFMVF